MRLDCPNLSLAPDWAAAEDRRRILVVLAVDAVRLSHFGEYELVEASEVIWEFERAGRSLTWRIADFMAQSRIGRFNIRRLSEEERGTWLVQALRHGTLVGLRRRPAGAAAEDKTVAQRRLVRQIEAATARGQLSTGGRRYKLIAGSDLKSMPERNNYEVVARDEALRVLGELQGQAVPDVAALLAKAYDELTPDWRPPLAPQGLVLMRRTREQRVAAHQDEPAMTPSQLWGKARKEDADIIDWIIWIELDPLDPKAQDDVVILLDQFYEELMRKPLASCPREGTGVLVTFEQINKRDRFTLIRDYGPDEGGGQDTLFIDRTPAEMDERGSQAS